MTTHLPSPEGGALCGAWSGDTRFERDVYTSTPKMVTCQKCQRLLRERLGLSGVRWKTVLKSPALCLWFVRWIEDQSVMSLFGALRLVGRAGRWLIVVRRSSSYVWSFAVLSLEGEEHRHRSPALFNTREECLAEVVATIRAALPPGERFPSHRTTTPTTKDLLKWP